jgi:hypothetical protein
MKSDQTTLSGGGLTLITTNEGRPVGRRTVESWYEAKTAAPAPNVDEARQN